MNERERGFAIALEMLSRRRRSEQEVLARLGQRGITPQTCEEVVFALREMGYLNDRAFAEAWVRDRKKTKPMGRYRLARELLEKGIERSLIDEVLGGEAGSEDELELALDLARARLARIQGHSPDVVQRRLGQFLLRRGFSQETTTKVVKQLIQG